MCGLGSMSIGTHEKAIEDMKRCKDQTERLWVERTWAQVVIVLLCSFSAAISDTYFRHGKALGSTMSNDEY